MKYDNLTPLELGAKAEAIAARHLKRNGYRILDRNLHSRIGEIDILARQGGTLVIVEVKSAREGSPFGPPSFRVDSAKRQKLKKLATELQKKHKLRTVDMRFDVVCVLFGENTHSVEVIENAFW